MWDLEYLREYVLILFLELRSRLPRDLNRVDALSLQSVIEYFKSNDDYLELRREEPEDLVDQVNSLQLETC